MTSGSGRPPRLTRARKRSSSSLRVTVDTRRSRAMRERSIRVLRPVARSSAASSAPGREQAADLRLLERPFDAGAAGTTAPRSTRVLAGRRYRDALPARDLVGIEATDAVEPDAGPLCARSAARNRDVDPVSCEREELPLHGRSQMAYDCVRPTRQDGGEEVALMRELPVAECVHAAPEPLEPAEPDAVLDCARDRARRPGAAPRSQRRTGGTRSRPLCARPPHRARRCHEFRLTISPSSWHPESVAASGAPGCSLCDVGVTPDVASRRRCPGPPRRCRGRTSVGRPASGRSARPRAPRARSGGSRGR